jgi:hypothetical protein
MSPLSSHPIFQIERDAFPSLKRNVRRNIVAFKGTEVYIAVGSEVRCAELREWYAMDGEQKDDKTHFKVHSLCKARLTLDTKFRYRDFPN